MSDGSEIKRARSSIVSMNAIRDSYQLIQPPRSEFIGGFINAELDIGMMKDEFK